MADTQDKENKTTDPAVRNKGGDEGPNKNLKGDDADVVKFEPEEEAVSRTFVFLGIDVDEVMRSRNEMRSCVTSMNHSLR